MFSDIPHGSGRVSEIQGNVPIHVVVWLENHPTAALAVALSVSAANVRWHFRVSGTLEVILRNGRVEVVDAASQTRVGSARIRGVRSAADFDSLPRALEPPPFTPPEAPYPATCGFACDLDGRVARFYPSEPGPTSVGPGLNPRHTQYPPGVPSVDAMVAALATAHGAPAHPVMTFAARVRDLVTVLALPTVTGSARLSCWFEDERVVVWPHGQSELVRLAVSALHARRACLGCSRHDPRDPLARGTYRYARSTHSRLESFLRDEVPEAPLDVATAARLLGRSPAELAATQLGVRFETAIRVDPTQLRRAT